MTRTTRPPRFCGWKTSFASFCTSAPWIRIPTKHCKYLSNFNFDRFYLSTEKACYHVGQFIVVSFCFRGSALCQKIWTFALSVVLKVSMVESCGTSTNATFAIHSPFPFFHRSFCFHFLPFLFTLHSFLFIFHLISNFTFSSFRSFYIYFPSFPFLIAWYCIHVLIFFCVFVHFFTFLSFSVPRIMVSLVPAGFRSEIFHVVWWYWHHDWRRLPSEGPGRKPKQEESLFNFKKISSG